MTFLAITPIVKTLQKYVKCSQFHMQYKTYSVHVIKNRQAPKMLFNSTEGARDLRELCKYGYDCQTKGKE